MATLPKKTVREILAYSDEQLDHYMKENGRFVSVQDPQNVTEELLQRLRDFMRRETEAVESQELNLNDIDARLQALADNLEPGHGSLSPASSRPSSPAITESPLSIEERNLHSLQSERTAYHELVSAGGRPPYPFSLLEEIFWNPDQFLEHEKYGVIVKYWRFQKFNKALRTAFSACHLGRWESFLNVQEYIREKSFANMEALVLASSFSDGWEEFVTHPFSNDWQGNFGFSEYAKDLKERLDCYGFSRSFQVQRNLEQQDKLTTWIEYLGYEHLSYDEHAEFVRRYQRGRDKAWQKMLESGILRSGETYEIVCDDDYERKCDGEVLRAETAVELAKEAVASIETERVLANPQTSTNLLQERLLTAQSELSIAQQEYQHAKAHCEAIANFCQKWMSYRRTEKEKDRWGGFLTWIEQQIPYIEEELESLNLVKPLAEQGKDAQTLKRTRPQDIDVERSPPKRRRTEDAEQETPAMEPSMVSSPDRELSKRKRQNPTDGDSLSKRSQIRPQPDRVSGGETDAPSHKTPKPNTEAGVTQDTNEAPPVKLSVVADPLRHGNNMTQNTDDGDTPLVRPLQELRPPPHSDRILQKKEDPRAGVSKSKEVLHRGGVQKRGRPARGARPMQKKEDTLPQRDSVTIAQQGETSLRRSERIAQKKKEETQRERNTVAHAQQGKTPRVLSGRVERRENRSKAGKTRITQRVEGTQRQRGKTTIAQKGNMTKPSGKIEKRGSSSAISNTRNSQKKEDTQRQRGNTTLSQQENIPKSRSDDIVQKEKHTQARNTTNTQAKERTERQRGNIKIAKTGERRSVRNAEKT